MKNAEENNKEPNLAEWEKSINKDQSPVNNTEINEKKLADDTDNATNVGKSIQQENKGSGIRAMLDKALDSYERLPMLEVVFDRLVRILSTSLRNFTSDTVNIEIKSISSLRFSSYINSINTPALIAIFKAIEWENFGLINIDGLLVYSLVDTLFGGRKSTQSVKFDGRPYTTIEQGIVKQLSEIILNDLASSFDPLTPATFLFERIENNPKFATISRPADAAILLQLQIDMENKGGKVEILFPYATLEPIRDQLIQVFVGEKFGKDSEWESHLQYEVINSLVDLQAVLTNKVVSMKEVFNLKVGSTIIMDISPEDDIILNCSGTEMFSGVLGKVGNKIAININGKIHSNKKEE